MRLHFVSTCISPSDVNDKLILELNGLGVEILLDHQRNLEGDCVLELAEIKSRQLADLFKTVNQRISMNEELTGGLGNVEIIFKEALNRHKCFTVKRFKTALLENFL